LREHVPEGFSFADLIPREKWDVLGDVMAKQNDNSRERRIEAMVLTEARVKHRLVLMRELVRGEFDLMSHSIDQVIQPSSPRRRRARTRKTFVDRAGNVVTFPKQRGGQ
jgi:hypothetical protein